MNYISILVLCLFCTVTAGEFTVCSYNCGRLPDHYDYLRAITMEKLMQERYLAEPELMSQNEKIQQLALKIVFTENPKEKQRAERALKKYTLQTEPKWQQKADEMITSYKVRPVIIKDKEVNERLSEYVKTNLTETRQAMAKSIFQYHLKFDIFCLQEADYLDSSLFPEKYEVLFSEQNHSLNAVAWNKNRFELVQNLRPYRT